jgi:hypothetical protein
MKQRFQGIGLRKSGRDVSNFYAGAVQIVINPIRIRATFGPLFKILGRLLQKKRDLR